MEERLLNKVIIYISLCLLFLTACAPYGLTGNPNEDVNDSEATPEELEALENMKTFAVTIEQFEKNIESQNKDDVFNITETGYETKNHLIQIDYKDETRDKSSFLTDIYLFIDHPGAEFTNIEKEFSSILELTLTSLEVSYDMNELITSVKENKGEAMGTEDVFIELANTKENIQLIVSPKE
jgi:hypothetical protein